MSILSTILAKKKEFKDKNIFVEVYYRIKEDVSIIQVDIITSVSLLLFNDFIHF